MSSGVAFADIDRADGGNIFPSSLSLSSAASCWCSRTMLFFPPSQSPASVEACARPRREKMDRARAASPISPHCLYAIKDTEAAGSSNLADDPLLKVRYLIYYFDLVVIFDPIRFGCRLLLLNWCRASPGISSDGPATTLTKRPSKYINCVDDKGKNEKEKDKTAVSTVLLIWAVNEDGVTINTFFFFFKSKAFHLFLSPLPHPLNDTRGEKMLHLNQRTA